MNAFFGHPLFLAGFRPFFTLAFLAGATLPLLWAAVFAGALVLPDAAPPALLWHAHELFFGFGWAVLGGFLLTASKNWVGVRGIHGAPLALAALLWIVERVAVLFAHGLPAVVRFPLVNGSLLFVAGYVAWTLVRHRKTDSYKDNGFFLVALPALAVAKWLVLDLETFATGSALALGLFRVAFVVMLERTMPPFMKAGHGLVLVRHRWLDAPAKVLVLLAAFQVLLPVPLATGVLVAAATVLLVRWLLWKPVAGLRRFETATMYVGSLALVAHLYLEAARLAGLVATVGALSTHLFTFLCMGVIVPSMLVRICQGHTGRKLLFTVGDRIAIGTLGAGAFFRLVATQVWPVYYTAWVAVAGVAWSACFTLLGIRLVPFLWRPRVDGKEH